MEGYSGFVHRASWIILGAAPVVGNVPIVRAPDRSKVKRPCLWRHRQRTAVVEDVVERLEVHAG
jgi:hypothetical protein